MSWSSVMIKTKLGFFWHDARHDIWKSTTITNIRPIIDILSVSWNFQLLKRSGVPTRHRSSIGPEICAAIYLALVSPVIRSSWSCLCRQGNFDSLICRALGRGRLSNHKAAWVDVNMVSIESRGMYRLFPRMFTSGVGNQVSVTGWSSVTDSGWLHKLSRTGQPGLPNSYVIVAA